MDFYRSEYKKEIILTIAKEIIDDSLSCKVIKNIKDINGKKRIGLDMNKVKTIKSKKFIQCLIDDRFSLFNLTNEVMCYLGIILKDGLLKSFLNKYDFIDNKRELIRRRLTIV